MINHGSKEMTVRQTTPKFSSEYVSKCPLIVNDFFRQRHVLDLNSQMGNIRNDMVPAISPWELLDVVCIQNTKNTGFTNQIATGC